jgi:hypothetical protein
MRRVGVVLLVVGLLMGVGDLLYWFHGVSQGMGLSLGYLLQLAFHFMPMALRVIALVGIGMGLILLLVSLGGRRYGVAARLRRPGTITLVTGLLIGLGYLLYWFHGFSAEAGLGMSLFLGLAFDFMPLALKIISLGLMAIGLVLLLASVVRGRYWARKQAELTLAED